MPKQKGKELDVTEKKDVNSKEFIAFRERMSERLARVYKILHPEEVSQVQTIENTQTTVRAY